MIERMQIARAAVEAATRSRADYADARVNRLQTEELSVRNGKVGEAGASEGFGLGVRVRHDGCFGFAAAPLERGAELETAARLAERAVEAARRLAPAVTEPARLAGSEGHVGEFATPVEIDPFSVPLSERVAVLRAAEATMEGREETVVRQAACSLRREEQWQASSEGAAIHQVLVRCGAGLSSTAATQGQVETRSFPASFGGNYKSAGWEHVLSMDLAAHGARVRDEAIELCSAEPCPGGERTLILGGSQLMLQIHESVGHPNELDRVFGHEVDLAGSSFATTDKLGSFRYGSELVNLVADSTVSGGLDTRGFDDECVPSGRWGVVTDGVFTGYHTSREWAARIGEDRSRGTARAEGWYDPPIIRITNLSLMPGSWTFDDLLADTEDGAIFADTVKMWSIDQRRLNFQFTCEVGREVRDGKLGRLLRSPTYQGTTPSFWASCDAICDEDHWELWGVPNCGKGNPIQVAEMSHGAAPARFRDVTFVDAGL
ncbi:MAG: TldD/PmbA family protein [Planctomycetota bacterium]|jgi:TldD protein|nr:TldD/PmbA family protein [Planctomycetota bacterium]MDP6762041.1 TldD/PmbA family protein [Planctomycetota bacterium]MDP6989071.1 TldD/PmbA family protein [Planctomycetota bacterium]